MSCYSAPFAILAYLEYGRLEQCVCIKFCFQLGKNAMEEESVSVTLLKCCKFHLDQFQSTWNKIPTCTGLLPNSCQLRRMMSACARTSKKGLKKTPNSFYNHRWWLKGNELQSYQHDSSKIMGHTWWVSHNALHKILGMVVWSLGSLCKDKRGWLRGDNIN